MDKEIIGMLNDFADDSCSDRDWIKKYAPDVLAEYDATRTRQPQPQPVPTPEHQAALRDPSILDVIKRSCVCRMFT